MTNTVIFKPGEKTHRDENFPVASYVIAKPYRATVLAFYRFARSADDVADHPALSEQEKIARLNQFEATLLGACDTTEDALPLRAALAERHLPARHALDLLVAFRQDARKSRYKDWQELLGYCGYSAAPVGRFVLDVHGENPAAWPASDALCASLQIINHLQDCKADYMRLDRVYIPQDRLARHGIHETALAAPIASQALRQCIAELAKDTQELLRCATLSGQIRNMRLKVEVATIERLAHALLALLSRRDPLSERVHLRKVSMLSIALRATLATMTASVFNLKSQLSL